MIDLRNINLDPFFQFKDENAFMTCIEVCVRNF